MTQLFVDTNVLVHAGRTTSPFHAVATAALARVEAAGDELCISRQVLREFLAAITRSQADLPLLAGADTTAQVRRLIEIYAVFGEDDAVTNRLLALIEGTPTAGKQVHDANIVATMLVHGVTRLLSFNSADFRRFDSLIEIVTP